MQCLSGAASRGLGFAPRADQGFHLVRRKSALLRRGIQALLRLLQTPAWTSEFAAITGYATRLSGDVLSMRRLLSRWDYRPGKVSPRLTRQIASVYPM